jgi:putative ABC transport system ATP-binding protein
MILEIRDLCKEFGSLKILSHLNLNIEVPRSVAILGKSGSGKSTLLSIIAGLEGYSSGEIKIKGRSLKDFSAGEVLQLRQKQIAMVFQQFYLMRHFTALENVQLPQAIMGSRENLEQAEKILERVGLQDRLSHFPHQMSGGECQRVAIARALVNNPEIILADEPSGNLDEETAKEVMDLLFELTKNKTLILVTHDKDLALRCDEVYNLNGYTLERLNHAS